MSITNNSTHKYTFTEPGCMICEHHSNTYPRYCHGFKKRKNPKRFTSKDPKIKAPKWCPKRLPVSVIRVYRYKGEMGAHFGAENLYFSDKNKQMYDFPSTHHYVLAYEYHSGITAKGFYEAAKADGCDKIDGFALEYGDVIEVDNGLKAYSFVYRGSHNYKPAVFDSERLRGATI